MNNIELLAPAGDPEKLRIALEYGADAVYLAGESFGLRAGAGNFSIDELRIASDLTHEKGKKLYLTLNIFAHNEDIEKLEMYLDSIKDILIDGYLVSDPGVFSLLKEKIPHAVIHLSTQANTTNYESVTFWQRLGVKRIVLARELSLEEIQKIRSRIDPSIELESFVHGAMCISYSGRCLLSNFLTGRDANKGECSHPCRWNYRLEEEQRPGEYHQIEEDDRGSYIFNSKDLCMLPYIPELIDSGLNSLKIEGRGKSVYYLASVVSAYRKAIDAYYDSPDTYQFNEDWMSELDRASHRLYTTGFYFGKPNKEDQNYETSQYVRMSTFLGIVKSYDENTGIAVVQQRNKMNLGDTIEIFGPGKRSFVQQLDFMTDEHEDIIQSAPHPKQIIKIRVDEPVWENCIVCRKN